MKVALVYDRVNKWGGAERVLGALHRLFPKAPLYTSVYRKRFSPWASSFSVRTSFLQTVPYASSNHEYLPLLMPIAFETFTFDEYDLVISVTSEAAKGIVTKPKTYHICYCLTPTRYLWSGYDEYFSSKAKKLLAKPAVSYLRTWDLVASQRPDAYLAISKEVQQRIKTYYKRESSVVYPPILFTTNEREIAKDLLKQKKQTQDYFLVVSRLVLYKRIDLAVKACSLLNFPLVVIGSGKEESYLQSIAGKTVRFLRNLTDRELIEYYKGCTALLFPGREDFGLSMAEAQYFGKPVIAYSEGGAKEIVKPGVTGHFFYQQSVSALIEAIQSFDKNRYSPNECAKQGSLFSQDIFTKKLMEIVYNLTGKEII